MNSRLPALAGILDAEMIRAWPVVGQALANLPGDLMGGTAVAVHLRHRRSTDLDYMARHSFDGYRLGQRLERFAAANDMGAVISHAGSDSLRAQIESVPVQVFRDRLQDDGITQAKRLKRGLKIDGLSVASQADLMASKMEVITRRPKFRDYVDLAALDQIGKHTLEEGLMFHRKRYGTHWNAKIMDRIINLLEDPGPLQADRLVGATLGEEVLERIRLRALALRSHLACVRQSVAHSEFATQKSAAKQRWRESPIPPPPARSASGKRPRCGVWMPKSGVHCGRPAGHGGPHRRNQ